MSGVGVVAGDHSCLTGLIAHPAWLDCDLFGLAVDFCAAPEQGGHGGAWLETNQAPGQALAQCAKGKQTLAGTNIENGAVSGKLNRRRRVVVRIGR